VLLEGQAPAWPLLLLLRRGFGALGRKAAPQARRPPRAASPDLARSWRAKRLLGRCCSCSVGAPARLGRKSAPQARRPPRAASP